MEGIFYQFFINIFFKRKGIVMYFDIIHTHTHILWTINSKTGDEQSEIS